MKFLLKATLLILLLNSCKTSKSLVGKLYTVKSPVLQSRHIAISFSADYTFWMNYGSGNDDLSRSYILSGKLKYATERTILIIPKKDDINDTTNVAFIDEKFDEERFKKFGSAYYFPFFKNDTIRFSKNYKYFYLKGFKFNSTKGKDNFKK